MIVKHFFMGGPGFMSAVYILWIVVIFLTAKFLFNYFSENRDSKKLTNQNSAIIFLGSFAFLLGLFGQIIGMYGALVAIEAAGDISPALIAGGLRVSLLAPLYGFGLLLVSSIIWFVFRNLIKK